MRKKWEESKDIFLYLNDTDVDYLIENVSSFYMWSRNSLDLVSMHYTGEWWHCPSDGGGAVCILNDESLRDLFIRCRYQLDTRNIRYIK